MGLDIYNLFNRAPVLTYNQAFVLPTATPTGSWLTPTSVLSRASSRSARSSISRQGLVGQDGRVGQVGLVGRVDATGDGLG